MQFCRWCGASAAPALRTRLDGSPPRSAIALAPGRAAVPAQKTVPMQLTSSPHSETRWQQSPQLLGAAIAMVAVLAGALLGFAGPLVTLAVFGTLVLVLWALASLEVALCAVLAIITLLPFGTLPFKFVLTLTLLDVALAGALFVYLCQWMAGYRRHLLVTPAHAPLLAFAMVCMVAFVSALTHTPFTPNLARRFAEFLLSVFFAVLVVEHTRTLRELNRLLRVLLLLGSATAGVALVLYLLPPAVSERGLNSLGRLGYPTGSVLRYVEDNSENAQRAIGTAVDPNALGGMLAVLGALAAAQLAAARPLAGRRWPAYLLLALIATTLLLTFSRAAMASLLLAVLGIALLQQRRLLWLLALSAGLVLLLPQAQDYVLHFGAGLRGADLATQMRFGEYKDALELIGRYPFLGVGFGGAPDVDLYLGVSSAYLLTAEQTGLLGLAAFAMVLATTLGWGATHARNALRSAALAPAWLGAHAALVAALVIGIFDHYFVHLEFHPLQTLFWLVLGLALATTRLASLPDGHAALNA